MLGATRLHWADRRVSVAVLNSLSDARMAGFGALQPVADRAANGRRCPIAAVYLRPKIGAVRWEAVIRFPVIDWPRCALFRG